MFPMKAEFDLNMAPGFSDSQDEIPERPGLFSRLGNLFAEMKMTTLLRFYRFASFLLSTTLFILFPGNFDFFYQLSLIFLVLSASVLMVALYEYHWKSTRVMIALIAAEVLGISLLLAFTGGFDGPFLWYALNPFVVCTAFFPFALSWLFLAILLGGTFIWKILLYIGTFSITEIFNNNFYPALNLIVIIMIMNLFARMHMIISEQSMAKKSQQQELLSAYENLSSNYQVFKGLSKFQREVVAYKNKKDIYSTLIDTLVGLFPFQQAVVLIPSFDFRSNPGRNKTSFQVVRGRLKEPLPNKPPIQREIEKHWDELLKPGAKKFVIGINRDWIAMPLHGEDNELTAIFIGWVKHRINPLSFADNLALFITFAEQTTAWLSLFKQKERVLQHISSIYEAVEAASSDSDPRRVIDLFASYARALTDCDKTVFWMENTGSGEYDEYEPIYSVKGPIDIFPEEEWQDALLKAWSEVHDHKKPAIIDLNSSSNERSQLICVPVKSGAHCLGMLGGIHSNNSYGAHEIIQTFNVLADLSAIAVEKTRTEQFAEKLLVIDEQRRIANEIHDTISQNLFSIVYSIDALLRETGEKLEDGIKYSLSDIKNLSAETAYELRSLIYRLNPRQESNETFVLEIRNYLDKLARMNNVEINHTIEGQAEYLNPTACKALYRIIRESTGNALRHGKCSRIIVSLEINASQSVLKVSDNGKGFDLQSSLDLYSAGNRLGLVNMRELTIALQGNLNIKSKPGRGTEVTCSIPTPPVAVT
jgi:signal transduction histidine kinase